MSLKIYLDFDETIFDHRKMMEWMDEVWQKKYKTKPGIFAETLDNHHVEIIKNHRLYDHKSHFGLSGKNWDDISIEIAELIDEQNEDFCFPEVHDALDKITSTYEDVAILSFGDEEYQNYKINHCKHIAKLKLPVRIVLEVKRDFLAREHSGTKGVLVDDKYPLDLPDGWTHIWINRAKELSKPVQIANETWQISTLSQLPDLLEKI